MFILVNDEYPWLKMSVCTHIYLSVAVNTRCSTMCIFSAWRYISSISDELCTHCWTSYAPYIWQYTCPVSNIGLDKCPMSDELYVQCMSRCMPDVRWVLWMICQQDYTVFIPLVVPRAWAKHEVGVLRQTKFVAYSCYASANKRQCKNSSQKHQRDL